jgi:hypothetical protein
MKPIGKNYGLNLEVKPKLKLKVKSKLNMKVKH